MRLKMKNWQKFLKIHESKQKLIEVEIDKKTIEKNINNKFHEYKGRTLESFIRKYQRKFPNDFLNNFSKDDRGMRIGEFLENCDNDMYIKSFLNLYGTESFCKFSVLQIDKFKKSSGLYFFESNGKLIYIGMSTNLYTRFKNGYCNISPYNCYINGQSTNCKVNSELNKHFEEGGEIKLYLLPLQMAQQKIKNLEKGLIDKAKDKYNLLNTQHV